MKKPAFIVLMLLCAMSARSFGQSFDWNLRGGLNLMASKNPDKDISLLWHVGGEAGIRITSFGIYGELLYSMNENQDGGDPVAYFVPSIIGKGYWRRSFFVEFGASFPFIADDSEVIENTLNPDGKVFLAAGLGVKVSKLEISMRSTASQSYGVIQLTASVSF